MDGKAGRGRPRAFDRTDALERAMTVFWRYGYEATSLADLTRAMGINPPSLYSAFESKEKLFLEAVDRYTKTHGAFAGRALAEESTARAAIERWLLDAAAAFTRPSHPGGCMVHTAAANCSPTSARVEEALRRRRALSQAGVRARLEWAVASGELPPDADAAHLATFYTAVYQGMSQQARDGASRDALEAVARRALAAWPLRPPDEQPATP